MKTLALLLLAFTGYSQSTSVHFYYSTEQTTGAELLIAVRGTESAYLGGGFSGAWGVKTSLPTKINEYDKRQTVTDKDREEWCSLYATASFGYLGPVLVKYRAGLAVYNDKVTFNDDYTKIEKVAFKPLIGVSAMYELTKDIGLEVGFDNFNKLTAGITVLF